MSKVKLKTAEEALAAVLDKDGDPHGVSAPFICPYDECAAYAQHYWGVVNSLIYWPTGGSLSTRPINAEKKLIAARCTVCNKEVIFFGKSMIVPSISQAPAPVADLPDSLAEDFEEARRVLPISPRGAAALLRLIVQKLLPLIGAKEGDINKMIGELVANGTISRPIQQALDAVRVIGNEAVHPGTMDLKDDRNTATSLFSLINFIVEKAITEPKAIGEIFAGLPAQKLAGIESRDKPKALLKPI